jgi:hypothetical protein
VVTRSEGRRIVKEIRHADPNAKLPPRKDGKEVDRLDLWSALVIRAAEQLEQNEKEDAA